MAALQGRNNCIQLQLLQQQIIGPACGFDQYFPAIDQETAMPVIIQIVRNFANTELYLRLVSNASRQFKSEGKPI